MSRYLLRFVVPTLFIIVTTMLIPPPSAAQCPAPGQGANQRCYIYSVNLGSGNGYVDYREITTARTCTVAGKYTYNYSFNIFDQFAYTTQNIPISGSFTSYTGSPGYTGCPKNTVYGHPLTLLERNYQIYVYPSNTTDCSLQCMNANYVPGTFGYINPKYVVAGVLYAPPGSRSTAVYTNSMTVSNTSSVSQSFASSTTVSDSTQVLSGLPTPTSVFAWLNGTETSTSSDTETQQSQNSLSVTLTYNTSRGVNVPGPQSDYVGLDHNYDIVKVWINPVLLFTVYNTTIPGETNIGWWGYGSSALDPTAPIDVWDVPVGCLNGHFAPTDSACAPTIGPQGAFQRTWAANENWPSGEGPNLTQTDLNNILAADPWGTCYSDSPVGSSACPSYSTPGFLLPNFTLSSVTQLQYTQAPPGGQPVPESVTVSTTNSQTGSSSTTSTYSQTFGYEFDQVGTGFLSGFSSKLNFSQTMTWSYSYNTSLMTANTQTGTATIAPPACAGNPCNPSYPPSLLTFGSAIAFDVFVDNRFGTFAFLPAAY